MMERGTFGNTLTRKAVKASSIPTPSSRSEASSKMKLCSSNAIRSMSMFMRGQRLDRAAKASCLWKDLGVAGQSMTGALDQLVMAVFGEMLRGTLVVASISVSWGTAPEGKEDAAK